MKAKHTHFKAHEFLLFTAALIAAILLCVCVGSVAIPLKDTVTAI